MMEYDAVYGLHALQQAAKKGWIFCAFLGRDEDGWIFLIQKAVP